MKSLTIVLLIVVFENHMNAADAVFPKFQLTSIENCEDSTKYVNLENKKLENGGLSLTGNVKIPFLVDTNSEFVWEFSWWKNDKWEKDGRPFKGKICFYLNKFAPKLWKETREATKPPIEEECHIKPDTYVFDDFQPDFSNVHLPLHKGRCLGKITITKDKLTICAKITGNLE